MVDAFVSPNGKPKSHQTIKEIDVLWITAGLGCDGETIAMMAATQPSIKDLVFGAIPGLPKVNLHNPVLAYENGDEFMDFFYRAEKGELDSDGSRCLHHRRSENGPAWHSGNGYRVRRHSNS